MQDKHMGNKISLWIKQRLFTSRNYDETMNALEKFSLSMKGSDEIALLEAVEKEQAQQAVAKVNTDEPRHVSILIPPTTGNCSPLRPFETVL